VDQGIINYTLGSSQVTACSSFRPPFFSANGPEKLSFSPLISLSVEHCAGMSPPPAASTAGLVPRFCKNSVITYLNASNCSKLPRLLARCANI
jgi:hypothetical protein